MFNLQKSYKSINRVWLLCSEWEQVSLYNGWIITILSKYVNHFFYICIDIFYFLWYYVYPYVNKPFRHSLKEDYKMNREYLTVKIEKASHDCISLRTPSKFSKALLDILPFSVKSLLIGIDNVEDDTLFVLSCSEDEYFAKLA